MSHTRCANRRFGRPRGEPTGFALGLSPGVRKGRERIGGFIRVSVTGGMIDKVLGDPEPREERYVGQILYGDRQSYPVTTLRLSRA
jgi:hypothetical protein